MADFSDSEDEIPYPLPPTTVAPPTTTATATAAPTVFNVPASSSASDTATFQMPKKNNSCRRKREEAFGKEKKTANTVGGGSSHFSTEETMSFLMTMEEILPFGDPEWQIVVNLHNNNHGLTRSKESLQRKFNKLRNTKIPTGDPHCPADVRLAKKVAQLMVQKSNAVDLEEIPAVDKAVDDNLSEAGGCPAQETATVDYSDTFCNMTPVAKTDQRSNARGHPPSIVKSNGIVEMMHLQMQQQAFLYQRDREDKAEREKRQLEELKEEREERRLERQQQQQTMMMLMVAMRGGDVSKFNWKDDNESH
jgi:hypothetical protein